MPVPEPAFPPLPPAPPPSPGLPAFPPAPAPPTFPGPCAPADPPGRTGAPAAPAAPSGLCVSPDVAPHRAASRRIRTAARTRRSAPNDRSCRSRVPATRSVLRPRRFEINDLTRFARRRRSVGDARSLPCPRSWPSARAPAPGRFRERRARRTWLLTAWGMVPGGASSLLRRYARRCSTASSTAAPFVSRRWGPSAARMRVESDTHPKIPPWALIILRPIS
jgi:hypothetical protein